MSESLEDRMIRERAERKAAADKAVEIRDARREANRNFINTARKEEAQRSYRELLSPQGAAARPKAVQQSPSEGEGIEFLVYKEGVLGKLTIAVTKAFTPF